MSKIIFAKCQHCGKDNPIEIEISAEYREVTLEDKNLEGDNNE